MGVHKHMHERIQENGHAIITTRIHMKEETDHKCDAAVMVHMKESYLTIGFTENEQEGIRKLPVLLQIEDIDLLPVSYTHLLAQ